MGTFFDIAVYFPKVLR